VLGIDKSMEGTNCHGRLNGLYTDEAVSCHKCVTIPSLSITSMSEQKEKVNRCMNLAFHSLYHITSSWNVTPN
jgi:hypothetical protein